MASTSFTNDLEWDRDQVLVMGDVTVPISSVAAYSLNEIEESDSNGLLAAAGVLVNLGAVLLVGVMAFGWSQNLIIAVVLLMVFGVASLVELAAPARSRYHTLTLFQDGADPATFTFAKWRHLAEHVAILSQRGIERI